MISVEFSDLRNRLETSAKEAGNSVSCETRSRRSSEERSIDTSVAKLIDFQRTTQKSIEILRDEDNRRGLLLDM